MSAIPSQERMVSGKRVELLYPYECCVLGAVRLPFRHPDTKKPPWEVACFCVCLSNLSTRTRLGKQVIFFLILLDSCVHTATLTHIYYRCLVQKRGLEPPQAFTYMVLGHGRLPISPFLQVWEQGIAERTCSWATLHSPISSMTEDVFLTPKCSLVSSPCMLPLRPKTFATWSEQFTCVYLFHHPTDKNIPSSTRTVNIMADSP